MIARTLVSELSHMVAVLAADLGTSPYQMMVFRGIIEVLEPEGHHLLFHNVRHEGHSDEKTLASLNAYHPAGYIILKGAEGEGEGGEHARKIVADGIPLVAVAKLEGVETHSVTFDARTAMRVATDYVIEKGHRRLGHLACRVFGSKDRQIGFVESLINHDIPLTDAVIVDAGETPAAGYQAALEVLRNPETRPTALLCFNDMVAMGVYRAAHELSLDIPGDLSVVGFDGIDFGELFGPPLTSVDIFPTLLGRKAAELLLKVMRNQVGRRVVEECVEPKLIERASVRAL
jgi:DNA-binding LacI/PurR family transcriptional regulator